MVTVEIRELDDQARDQVAGTISWDGQLIAIDPPDRPLLQNIVSEQRIRLPDGRILTSQSDPEEWLRNLYRELRPPYLRATQPPPDATPREMALAMLHLKAKGKEEAAAEVAKLAAAEPKESPTETAAV